MRNIIFISPPGAGKGTQSIRISQEYNIPTISFGELLREEARTGSDLGNYIHDLQTKGILVDNNISVKVLNNRLEKDDCRNGYILDGYPRNLEQANSYNELLNRLNMEMGLVIFLNPPYEEIKKRIIGRLNCPKCKATFNEQIDFLKPKKNGICDTCGEQLVRRSDDNEESYKTRYNVYITETMPVINYYRDLGVLYEVNEVNIDEVTSKIRDIIEANND